MKKITLIACLFTPALSYALPNDTLDNQLINACGDHRKDYNDIKQLLDAGASARTRYEQGGHAYTPLSQAILRNNYNYKIIKLLLDYGADSNEVSGTMSILATALSTGAWAQTIKYLTKAGAVFFSIQEQDDAINSAIRQRVDLGNTLHIITLNGRPHTHIQTMNKGFPSLRSTCINSILCDTSLFISMLTKLPFEHDIIQAVYRELIYNRSVNECGKLYHKHKKATNKHEILYEFFQHVQHSHQQRFQAQYNKKKHVRSYINAHLEIAKQFKK